MTIRAQCTNCGKAYQFKDAFSGKKVRCSQCRALFLIPSAPPPLPEEEVITLEMDDESAEEETASSARSSRPRGRGQRRRAEAALDDHEHATGPCFICGKHKADSEVAYFRVVGVRTVLVATLVRWINLRTYCCEKCFRNGRRIFNARLFCILFWMVLLPGLFWGAAGIMALVGAENLAVTTAIVGAFVMLPGFIIGPVWASVLTRRRLAEYLGPDRDEQLREIANVKAWGFAQQVVVLRKIPKKQTFQDIS